MAIYHRCDFANLADKGENWETFKHFEFEPGRVVYYVTYGSTEWPQETRCFESEEAARAFYDIVQLTADTDEKYLEAVEFGTSEVCEELAYECNGGE